jgi:hypothetical protein
MSLEILGGDARPEFQTELGALAICLRLIQINAKYQFTSGAETMGQSANRLS